MKKLDFSAIPVAFWVLLGLFLVASILELVFAFQEKERARAIVKPFCLLLLGTAAVIYHPEAWLIYCGAYLGATGDLLLLFKKNKTLFNIGSFLFFLGHICYIAEYCFLVSFPWWIYLILGLAFLAALIGLTPLGIKITKEKKRGFGCALYFATLFSDFLTAFLACFFGRVGYLFLSALGGLFFIGSDIFLLYTSFIKDVKRRDFYVMLTYLLGQLLIVLGLAFTC